MEWDTTIICSWSNIFFVNPNRWVYLITVKQYTVLIKGVEFPIACCMEHHAMLGSYLYFYGQEDQRCYITDTNVYEIDYYIHCMITLGVYFIFDSNSVCYMLYLGVHLIFWRLDKQIIKFMKLILIKEYRYFFVFWVVGCNFYC